MINAIDPSPYEPGGAYVAATMYKLDDFHPYLYKTSDYGATWTRISSGDNGIPADHFTRVVRADPGQKGLLYAGTERGVYVSFDDGGHWQPLQGKLPIVPVTDLLVHDGSLIAATQGRAFWMLDDLTPLREMARDRSIGVGASRDRKPLHLFAPAVTYRTLPGFSFRPPHNEGTNPPTGVSVSYLLSNVAPGTAVKLELLTADGRLIRAFSGEAKTPAQKEEEKKVANEKEKAEKGKVTPAEPASGPGAGSPAKTGEKGGEAEAESGDEDDPRRAKPEPKVPAEPGLNHFAWDLAYPDAKRFPGLVLWGAGGLDGPRVVPGKYQVRLTVGKESATQGFEVRPDPRSAATPRELQAQLDFLLATRDKLSEVHEEIRHIRDVHSQLADIKKRLGKGEDKKPLVEAADDLDKKLTTIEEALYQTKNHSVEDPLNFPIRLNDKLANLAQSVAVGDYPPTAQAEAVRKELTAAIDAQLAKLKEVWERDLPAFNKRVADSGLPAVLVRTEEEKKP